MEPKNILRVPGGSEPTKWIGKTKAEWFEETYSRVHRNAHGHEAKVKPGNMEEVFCGVTFAFVAVDEDDDRTAICEFLAIKGIPCVVAGISLAREERQVIIEMRIVTGHPDVSSWQKAIPQLGKAGQDDYGSLDLPDVYSMAASWAVQSWRKVRGQVLHADREECLSYYADDQQLILQGL